MHQVPDDHQAHPRAGRDVDRREEVRIRRGLFSGSQNLASYLEEWLKDAVEPSVSRRTHQKRAWAVNSHISPGLGRTRLDDLEPRAVQGLYASMTREGYAHETRLVVHVTLKMALKQAVRWGFLGRNAPRWWTPPGTSGRVIAKPRRTLGTSPTPRPRSSSPVKPRTAPGGRDGAQVHSLHLRSLRALDPVRPRGRREALQRLAREGRNGLTDSVKSKSSL